MLLALMGAAFIPLMAIGGIFSFYSVSIYKTRTVDMLVRDVTLRRQNLDRFLGDRILALKWVARAPAGILTDQSHFDDYTHS